MNFGTVPYCCTSCHIFSLSPHHRIGSSVNHKTWFGSTVTNSHQVFVYFVVKSLVDAFIKALCLSMLSLFTVFGLRNSPDIFSTSSLMSFSFLELGSMCMKKVHTGGITSLLVMLVKLSKLGEACSSVIHVSRLFI